MNFGVANDIKGSRITQRISITTMSSQRGERAQKRLQRFEKESEDENNDNGLAAAASSKAVIEIPNTVHTITETKTDEEVAVISAKKNNKYVCLPRVRKDQPGLLAEFLETVLESVGCPSVCRNKRVAFTEAAKLWTSSDGRILSRDHLQAWWHLNISLSCHSDLVKVKTESGSPELSTGEEKLRSIMVTAFEQENEAAVTKATYKDDVLAKKRKLDEERRKARDDSLETISKRSGKKGKRTSFLEQIVDLAKSEKKKEEEHRSQSEEKERKRDESMDKLCEEIRNTNSNIMATNALLQQFIETQKDRAPSYY